MSVNLPNEAQISYLTVRNGKIVEISEGFIELSGFTRNDLFNQSIDSVWNDYLRIKITPPTAEEQWEGLLFTKDLEVRNVCISKEVSADKLKSKYFIDEIPNTRIANKNMHLMQLCETDFIGVAIYSVPDMILVKTNQKYLDFLEPPYHLKSFSIGRKIHEIIPNWKNSPVKKYWAEAIHTQKAVQVKEYAHYGYRKGITYWDSIITPIIENGKVNYVASNTYEVTDKVLHRNKIQEQAEIIAMKNKQLEAIIEHIPDAYVVYDATGHMIKANAEARRMYPAVSDSKHSSEVHNDFQYYDLEYNEIPIDLLPTRRAFQGEKVRNKQIIIKRHDREQITEINATPVFDDNDKLLSVLASHRDITEQFNRHLQLLNAEKEKREALETSIKLKDEFLYLITHEFRTPMAVINSALQAIELIYKNEVSANIRKYLNTIKQNTNRQLRLVNNLLDITKLNSGNIKLHMHIFDIVYLTKAIVHSVELYANQKGVNISFSSSLKKKEIYLDEEKYERIMLNLLANALKFTPKGKSIHVCLCVKKRKGKNMISVSVIDEGIGIPKDKQKVIFERFGQADTTLSRQAEGTGLGLHLVKLFATALEGEITLKSEEQKGSTFTILLPAGIPALQNQALAADSNRHQLINNDSRIIQAAAIEFSDIYL